MKGNSFFPYVVKWHDGEDRFKTLAEAKRVKADLMSRTTRTGSNAYKNVRVFRL